MIQAIINNVLQFIEQLVLPILALLPDSPFQQITLDSMGILGDVLSYINYFVPIGDILAFLTVYLSAVGIWYLYRWILRLAQYID